MLHDDKLKAWVEERLAERGLTLEDWHHEQLKEELAAMTEEEIADCLMMEWLAKCTPESPWEYLSQVAPTEEEVRWMFRTEVLYLDDPEETQS